MIGPKVPRPSKADEKRAYAAATVRDNGCCVRCGSSQGVQRDHRKNRSQGGLTVTENLALLCLHCHKWKTEHPAQAVADGYAVPGYARPEVWPGYRYDVGWVLYEWDSYRPITDATATLLMNGGA